MKKAVSLAVCQEVLELHVGDRKPDDKDHYANKRLKLAGNLMEELFRSGLQALLNDEIPNGKVILEKKKKTEFTMQ